MRYVTLPLFGYPPYLYDNLSESLSQQFQGFQIPFFIKSPTFLSKTLDNRIIKCGASRLLINKNRRLRRQSFFDMEAIFMLPVNCGNHSDYQNFVVTNLRKYYPNPDALAKSTWDIIERFWNLDLSETDVILADKYSKFEPAPRTPSCMQRSYLLSIDFKVTSLTDLIACQGENIKTIPSSSSYSFSSLKQGESIVLV